jgi:Domain of unknown function (DUF4878)
MKKEFRYWIPCLLFFVLVACTGSSPKSVAEAYLKAFNKQDYEKAKKYATDDTKKLLDMFTSLAALTPDSLKRDIDFTVREERIKGDTAYVDYLLKGSSKVQSLTLRKVDGNWKVAATKDTVNELEGGELIDTGAINSDTSGNGELVPGDSITSVY